jgi:hypothetical protein
MAPIPLTYLVPRLRQRPRTIAADAQLVLGQWAEIFPNGSLVPLRGFVFSLRPGEVLFTFPDLPTSRRGLRLGMRQWFATRAEPVVTPATRQFCAWLAALR